jgi:Mrp family chromosome partitioning ATPase
VVSSVQRSPQGVTQPRALAGAGVGPWAKNRARQRGSAAFEVLAVATLVLGGFVAYAFLVPRQFEGVGVFTLSPRAEMPPELSAQRVDEAAVFNRALRAARVFAVPQTSPEAALHAASVKVESRDGAQFSVRCRADNEETARERCAHGLEAAASTAPSALGHGRTSDAQAELSTRIAALTRLATAHPELLQLAPTRPPSAEVIAAWHAALSEVERARTAVATPTPEATPARPAPRVVGLTAATILPTPPSRKGILAFGLVAAAVAGLVTGISRRRAKPTLSEEDDDLESDAGRYSAPASEAPPPRAISSAPLPAPSSRPPQHAQSSQPPAHPQSSQPPAHPQSSQPPAPAASSRPPALGSSAPLPPLETRAPFTTSDPPPAHTHPDASLQSPSTDTLGSKRRTTQILGSPIAPRAAERSSSSSSLTRTVVQGSFSTRYSFVTTPPPPGGVPVEPHDIDPDWKPPARLDPTPCRPLAREIFAFGIDHCFTVGVTSVPGLDEEKSEFAASLALALAHGGHARVLLVEADFDRPSLHRLLELSMPAGRNFSRQLQTHMMGQTEDAYGVLRCGKSMHALLDGGEHTPGLILSRAFETCLRGLRAYYDFIVLDGPPGNREAECRAFDAVADGLIVVCTEEQKHQVAPTSKLFSQKRFSRAIRVTRPEA